MSYGKTTDKQKTCTEMNWEWTFSFSETEGNKGKNWKDTIRSWGKKII